MLAPMAAFALRATGASRLWPPAAPERPAMRSPLHRRPAGRMVEEKEHRMLPDVLQEINRKIQVAMSPRPEDPDAPFAMVRAPLKPRPPLNRSSVAVQPER